MLDGILLERAGVPAAVICTEPFRRSAVAMAESQGAPGFPFILIPHPINAVEPPGLAERAAAAVPEVVAILTGQD